MEIKLETITGFLKILTWKKITQAAVLAIIAGISYGFYENRVVIYNSLRVGARVETQEPLIIELSNGTINALDDTSTKAKSLIGGIQVVNVDFKRNTRSSAHFSFSDENLKKAYHDFLRTKIGPSPLFTDNESANQKVIDLINGDFVCSDFKETLSSASFPSAGNSIIVICSISIPPYYGRFSGYMNLYLVKRPTPSELAFIRQLSRDLSLRIYETDVDKSLRYQLR